MTKTVTLNIEDENGKVNEVEVSENFLELCWINATNIINEAQSVKDIVTLIEEVSSNDNVRSIIANIVFQKLQALNTWQDKQIDVIIKTQTKGLFNCNKRKDKTVWHKYFM